MFDLLYLKANTKKISLEDMVIWFALKYENIMCLWTKKLKKALI